MPGDVENVHLCLKWFFINALQIALIEVCVCVWGGDLLFP